MSTIINLRKQIVIDLSKKLTNDRIDANIMVVMDNSGSMAADYYSGRVQDIMERVLPIALGFTPDNREAQVPVITFGTKSKILRESMNLHNYSDYVRRNVKDEQGCTYFGNAIEDCLSIFKRENQTSSFLGLVKKYTKPDKPTLVLFFTDGEAHDEAETRRKLIEASKFPIFFQFIGIGNVRSRILRDLDTMDGRVIDNANYFDIVDISRESDEKLYEKLLTEFPDYIKLAKNAGLI